MKQIHFIYPIQLIEKGYEEFLKRAHFVDNAPEKVRVEYWTDCGGLYPELRQLDRCDNIEVGKHYDFYVNVTVLEKAVTGRRDRRSRVTRGAEEETVGAKDEEFVSEGGKK